MENKVTSFLTTSFFFFFFALLSVHYANVKTPAQGRSIASFQTVAKPWYDASWKF